MKSQISKTAGLLFTILMTFAITIFAAPLTVNNSTVVNTNTCDKISWTDSSGQARSASIVKYAGNPNGFKGGYISQFTYMDGAAVTCNESNPAGDLSGLGMMINHQPTGYAGRGWANSKQDGFNGTTSIIFQGANHVIYETEMDMYGDNGNTAKGAWKVKWQYMIRTGNDFIVDAISYDFSSKPFGTYGNDIRSPYCEMNWTGTGAANTLLEDIDGIEFCASNNAGASYIFKTRGSSPFTAGYTYNDPGRNIPYTLQWKNTPDREAGYVSTLDLTQFAAGGGYLGQNYIGSTSTAMPQNWGINYQSNGFQGWRGDKMTWGLPYGAAGGETAAESGSTTMSTFPDWTWRKTWKAYPVVGFTLLINIGKKTADGTRALVAEQADIHTLAAGALTAANGTVVTTGKQSLYDAATFTYKPAGYNHMYHTWEVNCNADQADVTLALGAVSLKNQTFVFNNYNAATAPAVTVNSASLNDGVEMFVSVDTVNKKLYVTFNQIFTGSVHIEMGGAANTPTNTNTVPAGSTNTFTNTPTPTFTVTNTPNTSSCMFADMENTSSPGDPQANTYGGYWYVYAGGTPATIWPGLGDNLTPSAGGANYTAYANRITGTVGIAGTTYPCIGMGAQLSASAGAPSYTETDISSCTGMKFWVKGDGKTYFVKVPYTTAAGVSLTGYNDYKFGFAAGAAWAEVDAPFVSFAQASGWGTSAVMSTVLQHAKEFQWQTDFYAATGTTTADLWVDEITLYGCSSCPGGPLPTFTFTNTFTQTPTFTATNTVPPGSTNTFTLTPTATYPGGTDCVNYSIDYAAVPAKVFMKKLTLKAMIGDCDSASVTVDGITVASSYDPAAKIITFNAQGTNIVISRNNYAGGATYAITKATLYNDRKWAYSFTFDDGRPNVKNVVLPLFQSYGYVGGTALNTQNMAASTDGYVMSWASADVLRAAGWSFFNHNANHANATCANISTETVPVSTLIDARWADYKCTHFVYPYVDTTNWTCVRDSNLFLSAEVYNGNNYCDVIPANTMLLNRNSMMGAGNAGTAAAANALADNAAIDGRNRWMIMFTHDVAPGSTAPASTYDTNEAVLSAHMAYLHNTYGAAGSNNMWFAPTDEVMQYLITRRDAVVSYTGSGACGAVSPAATATSTTPAAATDTFTPTNTSTFTFTQSFTATNTAPAGSTDTFTHTLTNTPVNTNTFTQTQTYTSTVVPTVSSPSLSVGLNAPLSVTAGQPVTVIMTVNNNGNSVITDVVPSAITLVGASASLFLTSGPMPAIEASLGAGVYTAFTWIYDSVSTGMVIMQGTASGNSGAVISNTGTTMGTDLAAPPTATGTNTPVFTATHTSTETPVPGSVLVVVTATPVVIGPNPNTMPGTHTDRIIYFEVTRPISKTVFKVYTINGRLIRKSEDSTPRAQGKCAVSVKSVHFKGLAKGVYYYMLTVTDQVSGVEAKAPAGTVLIQ